MLLLDLYLTIFFFQAEDGIRDLVRSRGLGDVYKRQITERARQLWFELEEPQELPFEIWVDQYFKAVNTLSLIHI